MKALVEKGDREAWITCYLVLRHAYAVVDHLAAEWELQLERLIEVHADATVRSLEDAWRHRRSVEEE